MRNISNLFQSIKVVLFSVILSSQIYAQSDSAFLFTYFKDNGQDGLHLAYSMDGMKWNSLNQDQSILTPNVGEDRLMRDPCAILGPDGRYHMVWTVSWGEKGIGYASTEDFIHWTDQRYIPVMEKEEKALNCWAPEIIYDYHKKRYMLYWATTIPGKFPATDSSGDKNYNHRMYYTTTKDFKSFAPTRLLFNDDFNVIDAVIVPIQDSFVMVVKDETKNPVAQKNLRLSSSSRIHKKYKGAGPSFSASWVEGPTVLYVNGEWIVYYDEYTRHKMGALKTNDWKTWTDISDQLTFPQGIRHGTALTIPISILKDLQAKY